MVWAQRMAGCGCRRPGRHRPRPGVSVLPVRASRASHTRAKAPTALLARLSALLPSASVLLSGAGGYTPTAQAHVPSSCSVSSAPCWESQQGCRVRLGLQSAIVPSRWHQWPQGSGQASLLMVAHRQHRSSRAEGSSWLGRDPPAFPPPSPSRPLLLSQHPGSWAPHWNTCSSWFPGGTLTAQCTALRASPTTKRRCTSRPGRVGACALQFCHSLCEHERQRPAPASPLPGLTLQVHAPTYHGSCRGLSGISAANSCTQAK